METLKRELYEVYSSSGSYSVLLPKDSKVEKTWIENGHTRLSFTYGKLCESWSPIKYSLVSIPNSSWINLFLNEVFDIEIIKTYESEVGTIVEFNKLKSNENRGFDYKISS